MTRALSATDVVEIPEIERRAAQRSERIVIETLATDTARLASVNGSLSEAHFVTPFYQQLYRLFAKECRDFVSVPSAFVESHIADVPNWDEAEYALLECGIPVDLKPHLATLERALRLRRTRSVGLRLADGSLGPGAAAVELADLQRGPGGATVAYLDLAQPAPPIEWIVPGWLARREIAVLASSAGSGKSTTVADLCVSVATGRPWCTTLQLAAGQSGPVLYFDEEQGGEEVARLFQRLYGCQPHPQLRVASMQGIVLSTPEGVSRIEEQIKTHNPVLVVLDTVAQVFAGMDLSKLEEVSTAFRQLFRLRDTYGCTVMLLTHYRKASKDESDLMALERVFGSVGFGGNPSTVWTAQRQDGQALEIRQVKRRGSRCQKIRVAYEENEAGEITLTAENLEAAEAEKDRTEVWIVRYLAGKGQVKRGELVGHAVAAGFTERTVARAMDQLCVVGRIEHPKYGYWALVGAGPASEDGKVANLGKVEPQVDESQW